MSIIFRSRDNSHLGYASDSEQIAIVDTIRMHIGTCRYVCIGWHIHDLPKRMTTSVFLGIRDFIFEKKF